MHDNDSSAPLTQASRGRRVERRSVAPSGAVLLADCSDSMELRDGPAGLLGTGPRRIDRLAKVLDYVLTRVRVQALICFADLPIEVPLAGRVVLPNPAGSTALDVALTHVGGLAPKPLQVIVLSDGMPNDDALALVAARLLRPAIIDAYYVGPDDNREGLDFMRKLAAAGGPGGRSGHFDMIDPLLLGNEIQQRLLAGQ